MKKSGNNLLIIFSFIIGKRPIVYARTYMLVLAKSFFPV